MLKVAKKLTKRFAVFSSGSQFTRCLFVSRFRPPWDEQRFPVQSNVSIGRSLFYVNHGASSFGRVHYDSERGKQQYSPSNLPDFSLAYDPCLTVFDSR
jgi:hypothetical protein